ncbi:hypothetical protein [Aeromonas enteropelogenes]|uniref:hypothetical protein n=1 Tax=Aeromonas enteropelogenes TaxID=29489 RepID=UPI003BA20B83
MLRKVYSAWLLKLLFILISFSIPAIIVREYSPEEFGVYSYLISISVYATVFQSGITASFRRGLSSSNRIYALRLYKLAFLKTVVLFVFFSLFLFVFAIIFSKENIGVFLIFCLASIFSPVVSTYQDFLNNSVRYRAYEIGSLLFVAGLVVLMSLNAISIYFVSSIWVINRFFTVLFYVPFKFKKILRRAKFKYIKNCFFIDSDDTRYLLSQLSSSLCVILFSYVAFHVLGGEDFGNLSLYQRFVYFPLQIFSAAAPIMWMYYLRNNVNEYKIFGLDAFECYALLMVFIWSAVIYFMVPYIVSIYAGASIVTEWLSFLVISYIFIQIKDILSIRLNASGMFGIQTFFNIVLIFLIIFSYFITLEFLWVFSAYIIGMGMAVLGYYRALRSE